jgi:hypothetical protein
VASDPAGEEAVAADSYPVVEDDGGSYPAGEERRLSSGLHRGGEGV